MSALDDRIIRAWTIIARAHRIDPSPANAERIARVVECAADVRDEAIALRDEVMADRDAQRTRADAAEAECVRLREEHAELIECLLADRNALRATVEGRTVAPTPQEIEHHWRMGGAWLVGRSVVTDRDEARRLASTGIAGVAWVALDGMLRGGRPCSWPTVAAEAATGAALAGEECGDE